MKRHPQRGTPVPPLITVPTASLASPTSGTDKPLKMAWLTSRSETRRQRETGWPWSDPPCCQYISVKGGKLADSIPVSLIGSIHTLRCSGSVLMPLKHKHTSLCTVHCLFVLSTTKERSFSAAQYLSLNDFPARVMRRVDSCCADCVKYFEKVNSRRRNSCQQI